MSTEESLPTCPQCGSDGRYYPAATDEYEHTQFACGSFIDDGGSFELALSPFMGAEDPCTTIAGMVRELAEIYPGSRYAARVAAFTFPPKEDDDA